LAREHHDSIETVLRTQAVYLSPDSSFFLFSIFAGFEAFKDSLMDWRKIEHVSIGKRTSLSSSPQVLMLSQLWFLTKVSVLAQAQPCGFALVNKFWKFPAEARKLHLSSGSPG
jgi:hypothetical protein